MHDAFSVHILNDEGKAKAAKIAAVFDGVLTELGALCPDSREFSIAKTKLEESCFFAMKAMARANGTPV